MYIDENYTIVLLRVASIVLSYTSSWQYVFTIQSKWWLTTLNSREWFTEREGESKAWWSSARSFVGAGWRPDLLQDSSVDPGYSGTVRWEMGSSSTITELVRRYVDKTFAIHFERFCFLRPGTLLTTVNQSVGLAIEFSAAKEVYSVHMHDVRIW